MTRNTDAGQYERDTTDLEEQMLEQEATIKELRQINEHLRSEQDGLKVQRDMAEAAASAAAAEAKAGKGGRASPTAEVMALNREHAADMELLRSERGDFGKMQEEHEEEIAHLQNQHVQEQEQLSSKLRAGEAAFDALKEAAEDMQHELMEIEELRLKNAELTDMIDEHLGMQAELAEIQTAKLESVSAGVEVDGQFSKFAFEMAEVELERLKKLNEKLTDKSKAFDAKHLAQAKELAKAKAELSTADAKMKGLKQELSATVAHSSGLVVQIEALGMALSKMKGQVDTSTKKGGFLSSTPRRSMNQPPPTRTTPKSASMPSAKLPFPSSATPPSASSASSLFSPPQAMGSPLSKGGVASKAASRPTAPAAAPAAPTPSPAKTNKVGLLSRLAVALKRNSNATEVAAATKSKSPPKPTLAPF